MKNLEESLSEIDMPFSTLFKIIRISTAKLDAGHKRRVLLID
jgi:hypothetical protein